MSDPIEDRLNSFDPGGPMNPMSPSDVRRRGDSLRRRKNAIAAIGSVVAIAVIATPIALLSGGSGDQGVDPANPSISQTPSAPPTPSDTTTGSVGPAYLASIPDDFPLAAGYPDRTDNPSEGNTPVKVTDEPGFKQVKLCGQTTWSPTVPSAPVDLAGVSYSGGEDFRARTLALYPDDAAATAALQSITDGYEACPQESAGGTDQNYQIVSNDNDTLVAAHTYGPAGKANLGVEIDQFVRVGNAVLLDSSYGEVGSDNAGIQGAAQAGADASAPVVDALEALINGDTSAPSETGTVPLDRQNLLMIDDLPTPPDYAAPWQEATDDTLTWACRPEGFGDLGATGSVAIRYQAPTDDGSGNTSPTVRARDAVLQFPDPDAARTAYDQAVDYLKSCEADQGYKTEGNAIETDTSYLQGVIYAAPEVCSGGCDLGWFDYQGVTLNGDRLVLSSYAQIGGPLPPENIRRNAQDVTDAAATRSGL